jgi:anti-sigma regulatory factor (Ser/Thr protein kinase)
VQVLTPSGRGDRHARNSVVLKPELVHDAPGIADLRCIAFAASALPLPDGLQAAAAARQLARAWLAGTGPELAAIEDDLVLLASELAANAAEHGQPPAFLILSAELQSGTVVVTATAQDRGPWLPSACPGDPDSDERHRGLVLAAALATHWGVRESADGKDIWCQLTVPAAALRDAATRNRHGTGAHRIESRGGPVYRNFA